MPSQQQKNGNIWLQLGNDARYKHVSSDDPKPQFNGLACVLASSEKALSGFLEVLGTGLGCIIFDCVSASNRTHVHPKIHIITCFPVRSLLQRKWSHVLCMLSTAMLRMSHARQLLMLQHLLYRPMRPSFCQMQVLGLVACNWDLGTTKIPFLHKPRGSLDMQNL